MDRLLPFRHDEDCVVFEAGADLVREGDPADAMNVIIEGRVRIHAKGKTFRELGPGEIIGEVALLDTRPRSASANALEPTKAAAIDEKRFLFMVQNTPRFALHVMKVMAARLRKDVDLIV